MNEKNYTMLLNRMHYPTLYHSAAELLILIGQEVKIVFFYNSGSDSSISLQGLD